MSPREERKRKTVQSLSHAMTIPSSGSSYYRLTIATHGFSVIIKLLGCQNQITGLA